ncbi:phosphatases II [Piromyces finnis]|uniref:protein-tyrosine-phosphatase n=1 Tax=Piromyces finnis TaxID=1754191 RepID=A0A1Y1V5K1_9FUNG|nr:phosphatases II [Piromyces finnis]|eukprot:ORX47831.1 phosphatases II [Piromyces finnis]
MASSNFKEIAKKTHEKFSLLDATNVFPGLYIGSMYAATDEDFLKDKNIKYILNVTENSHTNVNFNSNNNIKSLSIPMRDEINFNAMKFFPKTCEFIDKALNSRFEKAKNEIINNEFTKDCLTIESHDNILVHCQLGISRSATIVSAYLLYKYYEYNGQEDENNIDTRRILHYILESKPLLNENNSSKVGNSELNVPFDCVSSVLKYLQRKRPTIKPNEGFQKQLQLWQSKLEYNYNKKIEKVLKNKIKNDKGYKSCPGSQTLPIKKDDKRLSNSIDYLKIYSISKYNDLKYKFLSKKKSTSQVDSNSSKISKDEIAKKLNL